MRDVRPKISGEYKVKFKVEALPLKDQVGGIRLWYSHNVEFPLSAVCEADRTSMPTLRGILPVLNTLQTSEAEHVELVNATAVEEILQESACWISAKEWSQNATLPRGGPVETRSSLWANLPFRSKPSGGMNSMRSP